MTSSAARLDDRSATLAQPAPASRSQRLGRHRDLAKKGMIAAMAVTVVTGFTGGRNSRSLHLAAGVALVGFSLWHNSLYGKRRVGKS